jgi:hypothetical protein
VARIAIIHPEGNFNNNPNLLGIITILAERRHVIDIYAPNNGHDQSTPHKSVNVVLLTPQLTFQHDAAVLLPSMTIMSPFDSAKIIAEQMPQPDIIIGVDRGIIEAQALAYWLDIPYGLISYEIYFSEELDRNFKMPEIMACNNLKFAVCQDQIRARELCRENEIPPEKIIYIPVASGGIKKRNRSFAIHDALNIPHDKKLMLYMGEISCAWAGIFDVLEHTGEWPDNWNLILHHRYGKSAASDINGLIGSAKNVYFSPFQTIANEKMEDLLNCVDAGLAFYCPTSGHPLSGNNLKYIGLASGKISTYLRHGVPVVTNQLGEISDLIKKYEAGLSVNNGSQLAEALRTFQRVEPYNAQENCHKLFNDVLDLNNKIFPLIKEIEDLPALKIIPEIKLNTGAEILSAKKWLEIHPSLGRVVRTVSGASRSISLWAMNNLKVWSKLGIIVTEQGSVLEESTTEYNTSEALKNASKSNLNGMTYEFSGEYMSLSGFWSEGFYHWMLEWLPRAYFAETSGFKGKYILSKSKVSNFAFDSLKLLGISEDRIVSAPPNYWKPESLWVVESCHAGEYGLFPEILKGMREKLLSNINLIPTASPKRLYISRTNPNRPRRVVNETELMALLEKFGFEWIDFDNMSLKSQLEIVANADAIIGPHGAGIVHSLFIKENSLVIEIFAPNYINPCCIAVQETLRHRYHPLVSLNSHNNYPHGDNIHAPLKLIELTLEHELKNPGSLNNF